MHWTSPNEILIILPLILISLSILGLFLILIPVLAGLAMMVILMAPALFAPRASRKKAQEKKAAPSATLETPNGVKYVDRWEVIGYGGMGAMAGYCMFKGLLGEHGLITNPDPVEIAVLAILLPVAVWIMLKFVHPRIERRRAAKGLPVHHPEFRFWRWTLRGAPALVVTVSLSELVLTFSHQDFGWMLACIICGFVTWLWVRGVGMDRARAAILGGAGGWALGMIGIAFFFCVVHCGSIPDHTLPAGQFLPTEKARELLFRMTVFILGGGILCAACGCVGGLCIGYFRRSKPTRRRAAFLGALGGSALIMFFVAIPFALMNSGLHPEGYLAKGMFISTENVRTMVFAVIFGILGEGVLWAALGGAGGLWIDHSRSRRPMIGLLIVLLLATISYDACVLAFRAGWLGFGKDLWGQDPGAGWLDAGKDLARTLGWGLGLIGCPSSGLVFGRRAGGPAS